LHVLKRGFVCLNDVADASNLRVRLQVDWETVACALSLRLAAKAEDWERLIVVIRLYNATNIPKSLLVLIWLVATVVERLRIGRNAIASCVINAGNEANLPARA